MGLHTLCHTQEQPGEEPAGRGPGRGGERPCRTRPAEDGLRPRRQDLLPGLQECGDRRATAPGGLRSVSPRRHCLPDIPVHPAVLRWMLYVQYRAAL